jgi:hypothetical protein
MSPPLTPLGFCLSYQLLIRFSAHGRSGRQARRQGAEGESKRSKDGGKAKGGGEGNRRKAPMSGSRERSMIARGGRHAFTGHRPVGRVEVFRIHERAVPPESRGARRSTCGSCSRVPKSGPASNLEKVGNHRQGEEGGEPGDTHQRLTLCSPCSRGCGC